MAWRRAFIETAGQATQSFGIGRALGQIYAHVLLCPAPQSLDDLTAGLGISKGGASMAVRQLEQWGALRKVWVKGDRRDYYRATDAFGQIIRRALADLIGRRLELADGLLDVPEGTDDGADSEAAHLRRQVRKLKLFRDRARRLWNSPLVNMLVK